MKKINPAIIALSKTRLIAEIKDSEINTSSYSVIKCEAENGNTGVALYVINDISYELILLKNNELLVYCDK